MKHCSDCGDPVMNEETQELIEGAVEFDYLGIHYQYCANCIEDGSMRTDYLGTMVPAGCVDMRAYYDGGSSRDHSGRHYYQYPARPDDTFGCARCGDNFYGSPIITEDTAEDFCQHCAENYCRYEGDGEEDGRWYRHPEGRVPGRPSRLSAGSSVGGWHPFPGVETSRFLSAPLVGIEFEHAPVRPNDPLTTSDSLFKHITAQSNNEDRMVVHSDGSIAQMSGYGASEIVTFPASGDQLDHIINEFYRPFSDGTFSPGPEHFSCGFHVHVGSRFLSKIKAGLTCRDFDRATREEAKSLLVAINKMCREYISSTRRANSFCSSQPAVREKDTSLSGSNTMIDIYGHGSYPSVAVRTLGTIEFRLWPSSNSIRNTKARIELSQKLINYYDSCFINTEGKIRLDQPQATALSELQRLCRGGERKRLASALGSLLSLSPECVASLEAMSERFSPFTSKKTFFKFSDLQVASMSDEDSLASADNAIPEGLTITDVGDTTISGGSRGDGDVYISLAEAIKVYPSSNVGAHAEATRDYAKGDR